LHGRRLIAHAVPDVADATFIVRERRESDVPECLALAEVVRETDGYPPVGPIDTAHFLTPPYELAAWVAERDDAVIGHVALHYTGYRSTIELAAEHTGLPEDHLGVVARMFVAPTARRVGVARGLLDTVVAEAHRRRLLPVLDVAPHLEAAMALYESAGFERVGEATFAFPGIGPRRVYVFIGPAPRRGP